MVYLTASLRGYGEYLRETRAVRYRDNYDRRHASEGPQVVGGAGGGGQINTPADAAGGAATGPAATTPSRPPPGWDGPDPRVCDAGASAQPFMRF